MNNRRHKLFKLELSRQIFAKILGHQYINKYIISVKEIFENLNNNGKFSFVYTDHAGETFNTSIHIGDRTISCKINGSNSWYSELNKIRTKETEWSEIHNGKGWNVDTYLKLNLFFWLQSLEIWGYQYWSNQANNITISQIMKNK